MILQFVLLNLLMLSAAAILFVFIRTLPRIETKEPVKQGVLERWLTSRFPERMDQFVSSLFMRTLRRAKVWVLKADNALNRKMESIKLQRNEPIKGEKPDIQSLVRSESETEDESAAD